MVHGNECVCGIDLIEESRERREARRPELEVEKVSVADDICVPEESRHLRAGDQQRLWIAGLHRPNVGQLRDRVVIRNRHKIETSIAGGICGMERRAGRAHAVDIA